jgi:hypothetical protein
MRPTRAPFLAHDDLPVSRGRAGIAALHVHAHSVFVLKPHLLAPTLPAVVGDGGSGGEGVGCTPTRGRAVTWRIALATFGILCLELAFIRWMSGQVRLFAYFNNLVLMGAFLGMGLGVAIGARHPRLFHATLPVAAAMSLVLALSEPLGLMHLSFPDSSVFLWGIERHPGTTIAKLLHLLAFAGLFGALVAVFTCAGSAVGALFGEERALRAYAADLAGSLAGVLGFTLITLFGSGPAAWLLLGGLPFALLSRRWLSWSALAVLVAAGAWSAIGALFSPYNRIDLTGSATSARISVNRDFHQYIHDLSDERLHRAAQTAGDEGETLAWYRNAYDLPFTINDARASALIVGAGTGNDVMAALRQGYGAVFSVDIDPVIVRLGETLHPERPYADARATIVVDDARAFFQQYDGPPFDVVCFGLLDSHAMFSALSTLRLDNFVYTEEGIRAAWRHVAERGHLSISFSMLAGTWIADRLYWTIALATGIEPIMLYHGMHYGATFIVPRSQAHLALTRTPFRRVGPNHGMDAVHATTDDWPFLYIRPDTLPTAYVAVLLGVLLIALVSARAAFGRELVGSGFDPLLFLMGAGFLLVETRSVTTLSLLFGSTWMVNAAVFGGILFMALLGTLYVQRFGSPPLVACFVPLLLSLLLLWAMDTAALERFPLAVRGTLGSLVSALPIAFAGLIVPVLLAGARNPTLALGSNLLGSVAGGCLEYLSMAIGLGSLALLALLLYLGALLLVLRRHRLAAAAGTSLSGSAVAASERS